MLFGVPIGAGNWDVVASNALPPPSASDWNLAYSADAVRNTIARARELRRDSIACCERAAALRRQAEHLQRAHASEEGQAT
jgi:hypothetical protein